VSILAVIVAVCLVGWMKKRKAAKYTKKVMCEMTAASSERNRDLEAQARRARDEDQEHLLVRIRADTNLVLTRLLRLVRRKHRPEDN
jgi:hypothetical protein